MRKDFSLQSISSRLYFLRQSLNLYTISILIIKVWIIKRNWLILQDSFLMWHNCMRWLSLDDDCVIYWHSSNFSLISPFKTRGCSTTPGLDRRQKNCEWVNGLVRQSTNWSIVGTFRTLSKPRELNPEQSRHWFPCVWCECGRQD